MITFSHMHQRERDEEGRIYGTVSTLATTKMNNFDTPLSLSLSLLTLSPPSPLSHSCTLSFSLSLSLFLALSLSLFAYTLPRNLAIFLSLLLILIHTLSHSFSSNNISFSCIPSSFLVLLEKFFPTPMNERRCGDTFEKT